PTATARTVGAVHRAATARDPSGTSSGRLSDVIQIAADVHPGDSGGAGLNAQGQVVGIITAGPSQSSGNGTGFAIPINNAIGIVNEIRAGHGSAEILLGERGFMGVAGQPVDPATAAQLGLSGTAGILVPGVQPGDARSQGRSDRDRLVEGRLPGPRGRGARGDPGRDQRELPGAVAGRPSEPDRTRPRQRPGGSGIGQAAPAAQLSSVRDAPAAHQLTRSTWIATTGPEGGCPAYGGYFAANAVSARARSSGDVTSRA